MRRKVKEGEVNKNIKDRSRQQCRKEGKIVKRGNGEDRVETEG